MRTTFFYVLAMAAVPFAMLAGAEADRVELTLRKLRQELVSAVNAGDMERAMACRRRTHHDRGAAAHRGPCRAGVRAPQERLGDAPRDGDGADRILGEPGL